jgi:hypothetical protein
MSRGVLVLVWLALLAARPASASHSTQSFEFPGQQFGNETVSIFVMDALPADIGAPYPDSPRTVVLDFTLELRGTWYGNLPGLEAPFEVYANGDLLLRTSFSTIPGGPQSYPGSYPEDSNTLFAGARMLPIQLGFPLYYVPDCCTDILVTLGRTGTDTSGSWALHDVSLDWSRPIPEPTTMLSSTLGLVALGLRARWRSGRRVAENVAGCRPSHALAAY